VRALRLLCACHPGALAQLHGLLLTDAQALEGAALQALPCQTLSLSFLACEQSEHASFSLSLICSLRRRGRERAGERLFTPPNLASLGKGSTAFYGILQPVVVY